LLIFPSRNAITHPAQEDDWLLDHIHSHDDATIVVADDANFDHHPVDNVDRWIVSRLARTVLAVDAAFKFVLS
jgi:hypothetical protein